MVFPHNNSLPPFNIQVKETASGRIYMTPDGPLPSITTVISSHQKSFIKKWQNVHGNIQAACLTKAAAKRGTAVHSMIEKYLNNEEIDFARYENRHVIQFKSMRTLLNKITNVYAQEIPLWSKSLGVAGRVDCIGDYQGKISIIDFKTSSKDKSEQLILAYYLQATAYAIMAYETYGIEIDNIVILMAVEQGVVPLVFKKQIYPYIEPLQDVINKFYDNSAGDKI